MYLIPRNISNRFEFFPGWGWKELFMLGIGIGIGFIFCSLLNLITTSPVRFLPILIFGGLGYLSARPVMPDGSTALQMLQYMQRYNIQRKLYLYNKGGFN